MTKKINLPITDEDIKNLNAGDSVLIDSDYGSHILYYVRTGDEFWKLNVKATLSQQEYSAYMEDLKSKIEINANDELIKKLAK